MVAGGGWDSKVEQTVLAVQGLMKVGRGGSWLLGRTLCHCSEDKFFGPAANAACSSPQLVGPRRRDLEVR